MEFNLKITTLAIKYTKQLNYKQPVLPIRLSIFNANVTKIIYICMPTYLCNSHWMHMNNSSSSFIQTIDYIIQHTYVYLRIHNVWRVKQEVVDSYVSLSQTILLRSTCYNCSSRNTWNERPLPSNKYNSSNTYNIYY